MKKEIKKSVHDIVDFVYASGDLLPAFASRNSMQEGTKIHQQIASTYPEADQEYYLKYETLFLGYEIVLQGRIDILEKTNKSMHIIEVKSTGLLDEDKEQKYPNHFAQAKFYGWMLWNQLALTESETLTISVLYVNKYNAQKAFYTKKYSYHELHDFFHETMRQYLDFIDIIYQFKEEKIKSVQAMRFPYPKFRLGQGYLMKDVYEHIQNEKNLFINAPTGIGKSLGTIYPALKANNGGNNQLFYLTAKSVVKDIARSAVVKLRSASGLKCKSLSITAKEKICINDEFKCNPVDCPYAKDFYKKLNPAVVDLYTHEDDFSFDTIIEYAKKHQVCPFEFQLSMAMSSDIVICDYNYVFDPRVYLRRFFDNEKPDITLLIDEAHNMYDRVTGMYTTSLDQSIFMRIIDLTEGELQIEKGCQSLIAKLEQYKETLIRNERSYLKMEDLDEVIVNEIFILLSRLEKYFDTQREQNEELEESLLFDYFDLNHFSKITDFFNEDFIVWIEIKEDNTLYQISCLNPKELIKLRTNAVKSTIFFSATLHPIDYFIYLLGGNESSERLILPSPFQSDHLELSINDQLSTKYRDRELTKENLAIQIYNVVKHKGKYLVYFPSYHYLEMVYELFMTEVNQDFHVVKQERLMSEAKRAAFIDRFDMSETHLVGFAVLGGAFSEGIDLQGERLNGVVVVGVGLPTFDDYRKELRQYFDKKGFNGYRYAFTYPGFNKVLQAVGRVIRDENDYGIAVLIDSRYKTAEYNQLFPRHWSHYRIL